MRMLADSDEECDDPKPKIDLGPKGVRNRKKCNHTVDGATYTPDLTYLITKVTLPIGQLL